METPQEGKVEEIIRQIAEAQNMGREPARTQLHQFVCKGGCHWYRTKSTQVGFDRSSLTEEQRSSIERIVAQVMAGLSQEEARSEIHKVLCP